MDDRQLFQFIVRDHDHANAPPLLVKSDRIVFNIKGNAYRLVMSVDSELAIVWIKWIGTHQDYDRINVKEVEHE